MYTIIILSLNRVENVLNRSFISIKANSTNIHITQALYPLLHHLA